MEIRSATFDHGILAISGPTGLASTTTAPSMSPSMSSAGATGGGRRDAWEHERDGRVRRQSTVRHWNAAVTRLCVDLASEARLSGSKRIVTRSAWERLAANCLGWTQLEAHTVLRVFNSVVKAIGLENLGIDTTSGTGKRTSNNSNNNNSNNDDDDNCGDATVVPHALLVHFVLFIWLQCFPSWVRTANISSGTNASSGGKPTAIGGCMTDPAGVVASPASSPAAAAALSQDRWPSEFELSGGPRSPSAARQLAGEQPDGGIRSPGRRRAFLRSNVPALNQILLILCRQDPASSSFTSSTNRTMSGGLSHAPALLVQAWGLVLRSESKETMFEWMKTSLDMVGGNSNNDEAGSGRDGGGSDTVSIPLDTLNRWLMQQLAPTATDAVWQQHHQQQLQLAVSSPSKAMRFQLRSPPSRRSPSNDAWPLDEVNSGDRQNQQHQSHMDSSQDGHDVVISQVVTDTVVCHKPVEEIAHDNGSFGTLTVERCRKSYLYLLEPFSFANIRACSDCTVVVGAVAGVLTMDLCDNMVVIAATHQLVVRSCIDSRIMVYTPSSPVLTGDCHAVRFGPYNTFYPFLNRHLHMAGFDIDSGGSRSGHVGGDGMWKRPVVLDDLGAGDRSDAASRAAESVGPRGSDQSSQSICHHDAFELVKPAEYRPFTVPVPAPAPNPVPVETPAGPLTSSKPRTAKQQVGMCTSNPFPLHPTFASELRSLDAEIQSVLDLIKNVGDKREDGGGGGAQGINSTNGADKRDRDNLDDLSKPDSKYLGTLVHDAFKEWLMTSGNYQQICDLVRLDKQQQQPQPQETRSLEAWP